LRCEPKFFWTAILEWTGRNRPTSIAKPGLDKTVKMHSVIRPNAWVALKLPSGSTKVLQIAPNT
jgi:hypothetical protein